MTIKKRETARQQTPFEFYKPTQEVALKAVTMAVATDAMICTIHLMVSFFVIRLSLFTF